MSAPYFLAWATVLTVVWALPLLWLFRRDANGTVKGKLRCQGYPFGWDADPANRAKVIRGMPVFKLENLSDEPIVALISHFRATLDGKTSDEIDTGPITIQAHATVEVRPRPVDLNFVGPGQFSGRVEIGVRYGVDERHVKIPLNRVYDIHIRVKEDGTATSDGSDSPAPKRWK